MTYQVIKGKDVLNNDHVFKTDRQGVITQTNKQNYEIENGNSYVFTTSGVDLADTEEYNILIKNNSKFSHIKFGLIANQQARYELIENPSVTSSGTEVTIYNRNRNSDKSSTMKLYKKPTLVANSGTKLIERHVGSSGKAGGVVNGEHEFILNSGTLYNFKLVSEANGCEVNGIIDWYENDEI